MRRPMVVAIPVRATVPIPVVSVMASVSVITAIGIVATGIVAPVSVVKWIVVVLKRQSTESIRGKRIIVIRVIRVGLVVGRIRAEQAEARGGIYRWVAVAHHHPLGRDVRLFRGQEDLNIVV